VTTNPPSTHVRPSPEEIEFAVAYLNNNRNAAMTGRELWPNLAAGAQKGSLWTHRAGVELALRAVEERSHHQIRTLMEAFGAGEERRMEVVAGIINGFGEATNSDRMKSIEYADKREGRVTEEKHDDGFGGNILEGFVLGAFRFSSDGGDTGLSGYSREVPVYPDEGSGSTTFQAVADADGASPSPAGTACSPGTDTGA